jgi:hypothetical protein
VIEANKYSSVLIAMNISKKIDYSYRLVSVISLSPSQSDHINQLGIDAQLLEIQGGGGPWVFFGKFF